MKRIQFTITENEIKKRANCELTVEQTEEILTTVENDESLWNDIEESIDSATKMILGVKKS